MREYDVLIVGGGHAGVALVGQLAKSGFAGSIAVVDAQDGLPYERPPLSKGFVLDEADETTLLLRHPEYWTSGVADHLPRTAITRVDPDARVVEADTGELFRYGSLVWATGASARRLALPGGDAANVLSLRTLDDARRLKNLAGEAARIVIIGGGYIGLETAATLAKLGKQVTVVEIQERLLARVAGVTIADHLLRVHAEHGVRVLLRTGVAGLDLVDGHVRSVLLTDGGLLPADVLVVGIGVEPRIGPVAAAGAEVGNGVLVDEWCRTSLQDVYAIGDIAAQENEFAGGAVVRLESVPNVTEQAKLVAAALTGTARPMRGVPWFWSNQYDVRLQIAGLLVGFDQEVRRAADGASGFVVGYFKDGRLIAADCVNAPRDFNAVKTLLGKRVAVPPERFSDSAIPLPELAKHAAAPA
ncbi:NAD(P)/FAD-dependent oxidoreductase [Dactylosporangium sp. NPDC048998]|uniref:NAD(P)/FAD-dependent oxidoreductase n=1 Tax=Dactylosporangium sp. NPDC048998 TaxID=3363976 RepID=UPI00371486A2